MSLLNLNTPNKQWNMYLNTLSSISGDDLTIKPDARRNLLLEVSGNNNIFIKKGDVSYNLTNLITGDTSFSNVDVSVNLNPLLPNNSSLGSFNKLWNNAYIRNISATNISISGNMTISGTISNVIRIIPRLANDISSSLGTNTNIWQQAFIRDLSSISTINGSTWPITGSAGPTGPTGPTGPMGAIGPAGTTITATWRDISNLRLTTYHRIYQEISGDISWNAVNGYYGLAKVAYPSLNPLSRFANTIYNLNGITGIETSNWISICWSPELGLFVAVAFNARVMTSSNGKTWNSPISAPITSIRAVCWSPERKLFLAVSDGGSPNRAMTSINGIDWIAKTPTLNSWWNVCWSGELGIFVAIASGGTRAAYSTDGTTWVPTSVENNDWRGLCWSAEVRLFVAVAQSGNNRVMTSSNGINWIPGTIAVCFWTSVCWSPQLGIFLAVGTGGATLPNGTFLNVAISSNGITWTSYGVTLQDWFNVCWSPQLRLFLAVGNSRCMSSPNGINWTTTFTSSSNMRGICWSPEVGIFATTADSGGFRIMTSSLKGRPPTSYNVFDSSFNRIDENGKWDFSNINVTYLTAGGASVSSDDRLKHNEVVIANGLDIIDQLTPKFYQKTQVLLDASYNGDLSGYAWNYEAGLIAQELLQISDLSFTVGGGDYYEQTYKYIAQTNDLSNAYYGLSNAYYDLSNSYYGLSNANYDLSNTNYEISANNYELRYNYYEPSANNYEVSYNLISQPYNVNYNSVFVYGLAAIKELHAKVKAQEATLLNQKNIVTSLLTKIATLENNRTNS